MCLLRYIQSCNALKLSTNQQKFRRVKVHNDTVISAFSSSPCSHGMFDHSPSGIFEHSSSGMFDHSLSGMFDHSLSCMFEHSPLGMFEHSPLGVFEHSSLGLFYLGS